MFAFSRAAHAARRNWRRAAAVTAATAGVIVLSAGAGYTAAMITSADIKNQTIRSADISENGVGASELRHGAAGAAVTSSHIRDNAIRPHDLGDLFEADATAELEEYSIASDEESMGTGPQTVEVTCREGLVAIGGGGYTEGAGADTAQLSTSRPVVIEEPEGFGTAVTWRVVAHGGSSSTQVGAYVICAAYDAHGGR